MQISKEVGRIPRWRDFIQTGVSNLANNNYFLPACYKRKGTTECYLGYVVYLSVL